MLKNRAKINKRLSLIGIELGNISAKLSFYVLIAGLTFFLGGAYLVVNLPDPTSLAYYMVIMLLVIALQVVQIIRRDREDRINEGFQMDVSNFINGRDG